jgi:hypothetical protein
MLVVIILVVVVLVLSVTIGATLVVRRPARPSGPDAILDPAAEVMRLEPGELAMLDGDSVDLETVLAEAGVALYVPVDSGRTFLAVAGGTTQVEGRASSVPTQLAAAAVAGQAGVEALVKAGQLTGRLVTVDAATAQAIRAGTMVTDKAGDMLGIIRGTEGAWSGLSRIKPLSGGLVKSAAAGPAMLSAIAMQAQLAQVEKSIGEVRDVALAIRGHLEEHERAEVEGRRASLASAYRTAMDAGEMTQGIWDGIQHLEDLLGKDIAIADRRLAEAVRTFTGSREARVSKRLTWMNDAGEPVAAALASVADARRAFIQFSVLRLWWLAVSDDSSLASRQAQLGEAIAALPDHVAACDAVQAAVQGAVETSRLQRIAAPRKHRELQPHAADAELRMVSLPWQVVDIDHAPELEERPS